MRGAQLRQALTSGPRVYGFMLEGYGQPRWSRYLASLDVLDYVFLDSEHTPQNRETIAWAVQAYDAQNIAPLLRIPEVSASQAAMGVDAGAHGIIVPYVETPEQVRQMVGAIKYRPLKGAALRRAVEEGVFPSDQTRDYLPLHNPDAVLVIMVESPAGVKNLDAMLAVGGVDAVLIGPHDLSISHGVPEQYDHPVFVSAVQSVIATCQRHSVGVGMHTISGSVALAADRARWGFNMICHRSDTLYIARGIQQEIQELRQMLGDDAAEPDFDDLGAAGHAQ
jgi:4-hydroxy-2-oxoheptanedioate aldolase